MRYDGMGSSSFGGGLILLLAFLAVMFFGGMWILANTEKITSWLSETLSKLFVAVSIIFGFLAAGALIALVIQLFRPGTFSDKGFVAVSIFIAFVIGLLVTTWQDLRKK